MCFSCGRIRHKSKSCHYKIRPTEKFDESVDTRKVTTEQKHIEPNEEAFGPWVFVSRKRQPSKSFKKGKAHLPQEEAIKKGNDVFTRRTKWLAGKDSRLSFWFDE